MTILANSSGVVHLAVATLSISTTLTIRLSLSIVH